MNTIEKMAFDKLVKLMPDMKRSGLRKCIDSAIRWGYENDDYFSEELLHYEIPTFIPDATRFRKCARLDRPEKRQPIVEIWEIEDTSKITHEKMDRIFTWWINNFDGAAIPFFELWVTDRWGNNRNKVWSDYEDVYGRNINTFIPCESIGMEAVLI